MIDLQNNISVWPHSSSPPSLDTSCRDAADKLFTGHMTKRSKSAPWPSPVKVQSQTLTQFQQPPAILVTRCRFHKPMQHEIVTDFESTGVVIIISGFPEPWSKGLPNATKCVNCVVSGVLRCCEMLLDPEKWKSSKPVNGLMAKTRLLWNIIMKPNLCSFQQDCIWCPAQMDTMYNQILRNTVFHFNHDKQVHDTVRWWQ